MYGACACMGVCMRMYPCVCIMWKIEDTLGAIGQDLTKEATLAGQ